MAGFAPSRPAISSTLGVPLRRGRTLNERTAGRAAASPSSTSRWRGSSFPTSIPSDSTSSLAPSRSPSDPTIEIVGIVGDMKQSFEAASTSEMFVPYGQYPDPILAGMYLNTALVVRTTDEPAAVTPALRSVVRQIDPDLPLVNIRTMETAMSATVAQPRLQMVLLVLFAIRGAGACGGRGLWRDGIYRLAADSGDRRAHGARRIT